jgi:trimeric autotransporter adhesin
MKKIVCIMLLVFMAGGQSRLTFVKAVKDGADGVTGITGATSLVVSPDNKNVYVTGNLTLVAFDRDGATGLLTFKKCFIDSVRSTTRLLAVSPDNKNVYCCSQGGLAVYNRTAVSGDLSFETRIGGSARAIISGGVTSVCVSTDNKNVYLAGLHDTALSVFSRDLNSGTLLLNSEVSVNLGESWIGTDVIKLFSSPDDKNVYALVFNQSALTVCNRDQVTGILVRGAELVDNQNGITGLTRARSLAASPDNKNVYVIGTEESALAVFNRDAATGTLAFDTSLNTHLNGSSALMSAAPVLAPVSVGSAGSVAISPDSRTVYVTGSSSAAIAVFSRDISTGALTYDTILQNGINGVEGLSGAYYVAVSPDNKNVYAASRGDNAVAIFSVTQTTKISSAGAESSRQDGILSISCTGRTGTVAFHVPVTGTVGLSLLDARGKLVQKIRERFMIAGDHTATVDFSGLRRGVYVLRYLSAGECRVEKIALVK